MHSFLRHGVQCSCLFLKIVQQQYVGEAGKSITVILQIYSVYYMPNIREIGQRM